MNFARKQVLLAFFAGTLVASAVGLAIFFYAFYIWSHTITAFGIQKPVLTGALITSIVLAASGFFLLAKALQRKW
jgi:hypothetical protein